MSVTRASKCALFLGLLAAATALPAATAATPAVCRSPGAQPLDVGSGKNALRGVAAAPGHSAWAVGYSQAGPGSRTLIEHWNGAAWTVQASPNRVSRTNQLLGVAVVNGHNAWAVGFAGAKALIEHWDGERWRIAASPDVAGRLLGVAATSPHNAWAVGVGSRGPLIERWDGRRWLVQASPKRPTGRLLSVTAVSPGAAWAVGDDAYGSRLLIERWNGRRWSVHGAPTPTTDVTSALGLSGVAATSPTNAWAVGSYVWNPTPDSGSVDSEFIEHWNGAAWTVQEGEQHFNTQLLAVSASAPNDAWAVGVAADSFGGDQFVEHWDGRAWTETPDSSATFTPTYEGFYGVAAASPGSVVAVGVHHRVGAITAAAVLCG